MPSAHSVRKRSFIPHFPCHVFLHICPVYIEGPSDSLVAGQHTTQVSVCQENVIRCAVFPPTCSICAF